jgi:hypothetical protein
MGCRQELRGLQEGVSTFARAAHQVDPPEALKERVLRTLEEERSEAPKQQRRPIGRWAAAAVIAALAGALAWTGVVAVNASNRAGHYDKFLSALGGKDVRVGVLQSRGGQTIDGSVVMYDSDRGQSWILVLVRAPGLTGEADATVFSPTGSRIQLHPLEFGDTGEASTWLVTSGNISRFDRVRITDPSGTVLASGRASHE